MSDSINPFNEVMPCGHLNRYGPWRCLVCENERLRQKLIETKRYLRSANRGAERNNLVMQLLAARNAKLGQELYEMQKQVYQHSEK